MLNVVAWADPTNEISIGTYNKAQTVGELKFTEPVVRVVTKDGESEIANVTSQYNIEYSIFNAGTSGTEGTLETVSGVRYRKDETTGTTVKVLGGDVVMGNTAGTVWIEVKASPKSGSGATLTKRYEINISAISVDVTFTPVFTGKDGYDGSIEVYTKNTGHSYPKATAMLPKYKLNVAGTTKDVTDEFDVSISYASSSDQMYLSSDKSKIQFDQKMSIPDGDHYGTLTYTFTSKKPGQYSKIIKTIYVSLRADSYEAAKKNLTLSLTRNHIKQETVSQEDGVNEGYLTTHIYKYGKSDLDGGGDAYHYKTPTPSLLVDGTALPLNVTNGGGSWGDFKLMYKIESDETYYDDCQFLYYNRTGSIQKPGEPTGIRVDENAYQVAKPGLVKVAVYAVLDEGYYGTNLKAMYNPYIPDGETEPMVITDDWGGRYLVYAQPQYFYIDVMKRQPQIVITPDPHNLSFITGDVITMNDRFEISAIKGTENNGVEGALKWGANDGSGDHFAYQFFISDRNATGHITIDWPNRAWNPTDPEQYGDQYSFRDWRSTGYKGEDNQPLRAGDIIKTDETITFTATEDFDVATAGITSRTIIGQTVTIGGKDILVTPGNIGVLAGVKSGETYTVDKYILVDDAYIADPAHSDRKLQEGDFEKGITYNSMKGYGNENWTMTFTSNGEYNIPYTVRPWNHVRWDVSAEQTITFNVSGTHEPTEIELSYYYQVATVSQDPFNEPTAKVVTTKDKYDVTKYFNITYTLPGTVDVDYTYNSSTNTYTHIATGTTVNGETGEVHIGSTTGDVVITVHGVRKTESISYENPADKTYTIHIVNANDLAKWEVMSSCDHGCELPTNVEKQRFHTLAEINGRMHFYGTGAIYGGTVIDGVPGIDMTVGVPAGETSEWAAEVTTLTSQVCCKHEGDHSVIVTSESNVVLDENGIPTAGAFYKFRPTVNGFLTVDANFKSGHSIVLRSLNSITGEILDEKYYNTSVDDFPGDHEFSKPLLAGQTYYLFDETDGKELRLHGFGYQPAFIMDRSTTKAQSEAPLSASTFLNSLMKNVPELYSGTNSHVTFAVSDPHGKTGGTEDTYLSVDSNGKLDPHKMTLDGEGVVFKLRVTATVSSSTLAGECTKKTTYYDVQIIDIPTFKIGKYFDTEEEAEGTSNYQSYLDGKEVGFVAETTNIKTAIKMTFGGYTGGEYEAVSEKDDTYGQLDPRTDSWKYNNKLDNDLKTTTVGHHIEGHHAGDTWDYNKVIDNFGYFTVGKNNPVSEEGKGPLQATRVTPNNGASYTYGNGVGYEQDENFYYNTTYRLPARGAYLKFEPRESGTLIVYLWQNGSCDYHFEDLSDGYFTPDNQTTAGKSYQLKWRPLYITDETGKPVQMVNQFGNVSKYLDAGDDLENAGSYTLGLARCNKVEPEIDTECTDHGGVKRDGCSFDWSLFRGTDADAARLLAAWPAKGERESIIRLDNGGFAIPHKAYVRYAFDVKAGKTYFVFQMGSKPGFGGYSFVPVGFPDKCTYALDSTPNVQTQEKVWNGGATAPGTDSESDITFTWDKSSTMFNSNVENLYVTINDRRNSEITGGVNAGDDAGVLKPRTFTAGKWETFCLPFSVSEQEMTRVFGPDYVLVTCDGVYNDPASGVKDRILFTRHANGYAEAGRPYMVKPTQGGVFTFQNVTIEGEEDVRDYNGATYKVPNPKRFTVGVNNEEFIFKGVYMRETMPKGSYFVYNGDEENPNGLYRYNADAKIGGYRAYFQLQSGRDDATLMSSFSINDLKFDENDEETGIMVITKDGSVTEIPSNSGIYTIDGQKLSDNPLDFNKLPSGIYIVGGKKFVK